MKVAWLASNERLTWEPASALPQSLIDEFENGNPHHQVTTTKDASFGVINHTLVVAESDFTSPPPAKSSKVAISQHQW